jgi:hypothetical protein
MNIIHKLIACALVVLLSSCAAEKPVFTQQAPVKFFNEGVNNNELKQLVDSAIIEIKDYSNTKLIIYSRNIFKDNAKDTRKNSFKYGAAEIITKLIEKINNYPSDSTITINAYNFNKETPDRLQQLTLNQAKTMAALLWDYAAIDQSRVVVNGYGDKGEKLVTHDLLTANLKNDRIEIILSK